MTKETDNLKKAIKEVIEEETGKKKKIMFGVVVIVDVIFLGAIFGIGSYISSIAFLRLGKDLAMFISFGMAALSGMLISRVLWKNKK